MKQEARTPCAHLRVASLQGGLLFRCQDCGLVGTVARPTIEYSERYFTDDGQGGYDFGGSFAEVSDAARFVPELQRLEAAGLRGSVLDVGCATGSFLHHAQRRGWRVAGVERSSYGRAEAERRVGVPVVAGLDGLRPGARFDVVTLHHVLEHVENPLPFLRDEVLPRVGRRLLVEVPNYSSAGARVHGASWRDLRPDQHRWHFDPRTLPAILRQAGFAPVSVTTLWEPLWSLRAVRELLVQIAGLVAAPVRTRESGAPVPFGPSARAYVPPSGPKRVAVELSRVMCRPLVLVLERAGLGERLVVEAEPGASGRSAE